MISGFRLILLFLLKPFRLAVRPVNIRAQRFKREGFLAIQGGIPCVIGRDSLSRREGFLAFRETDTISLN